MTGIIKQAQARYDRADDILRAAQDGMYDAEDARDSARSEAEDAAWCAHHAMHEMYGWGDDAALASGIRWVVEECVHAASGRVATTVVAFLLALLKECQAENMLDARYSVALRMIQERDECEQELARRREDARIRASYALR